MTSRERQIIREYAAVAAEVQRIESKNPALVPLKRLVNKELPEKLRVAKPHEIPNLLSQQRQAEKELFHVARKHNV